MLELYKRAKYDQVGDYKCSEDLCVGVFDGTGFNSGTCDSKNITCKDMELPLSSMLVRDNLVQVNGVYFQGVLSNLTDSTQAQCVMTGTNRTACWVWDSSLKNCQGRCIYTANKVDRCEQCLRKGPIEAQYAQYVRRSGFAATSEAASGRKRGFGAALMIGLVLSSLVIV
ncbi:hypothetical protein GQ54DRAFT_16344 [Martensiomyces pterosporus]|nr:hypothetical protein GQ54DRAFT_16344 [Martensiomyces pterosporus]